MAFETSMNPMYAQQAAFRPDGSGSMLTYQDLVNIVAKLAGQYPGLQQFVGQYPGFQQPLGQYPGLQQQSLQGGPFTPGGWGTIPPEQVAQIVARVVQTTLPIVLASLQPQAGQYPGQQQFVGPHIGFQQFTGQYPGMQQPLQGGLSPLGSWGGGPLDHLALIVARVVQTTLPIVLTSLQQQPAAGQYGGFQQLPPPSGQFIAGGWGTSGMGIPGGIGSAQTQPIPVNQFAFAH